MTQVIVDSLPSDSFPEGLFEPYERGSISTYANQCGRYVNLQTQERVDAEEDPDYIEPAYFARGRIFHTMCEFYYGKTDLTPIWRLGDDLDEAYQTAQRLFSAIKAEIPQNFATVTAAELPCPRTEAEKKLVEEYVGAPFKMVVDALVEFDEEQARAFDKKWFAGTETVCPGVWIIDWKTESSTEREHKYTMSHQRIAYTGVLRDVYGFDVKGMLFVRVVDNKVAKVLVTQAPPAAPWEMDMVRNDFKNAAARIANNEANGFSCFSRYSICKYYLNGACRRV